MRKVTLIIILIFFVMLYLIIAAVDNDKNYIKGLKDDVTKNTKITKIKYINKYDGY